MLLTLVAQMGMARPVIRVFCWTSIETSVTQAAPLMPQALTCRVCQPTGALTGPSMEAAWKRRLEVLLSKE